jgi:DDB1- and CUL4-associated factor 6
MPHSNDTKMITCAGDNEVRVFDLERAAHAQSTGSHQDLSMSQTKGKVFRSHAGSVKRIVTEASPFYFLTCSEDGEVRQWDIRQNASFYPSHRSSFRRGIYSQPAQRNEPPPPLISYSNYNVELYTISCSPSQPHYIALGGTHVHCFLHDRRMMGRDRLNERGGRIPLSLGTDQAEQKLVDATRCVAKFAPYGQPSMSRNDTKQITACKLGQANPNELIVSWTGDHVYSFNILKSQTDAHLQSFRTGPEASKQVQAGSSRKRKRVFNIESPSSGSNSRPRTSSTGERSANGPEVSLLVQLGSGQSIELPISSGRIRPPVSRNQDSDGDDEQTEGSFGQCVRSLKNCLSRTHYDHERQHEDELQTILESAKHAFEKIDDHISNRTFPVTISAPVIDYEMKLRDDRAKVWRFAQASGTFARVLLGPSTGDRTAQNEALRFFDMVRPAPRECSAQLDRHEHFGYDFCKAILLWLESGVGAVLREFSPESRYATAGTLSRFPVSKDANVTALEKQLIPYLLNLAADMPVVYAGHGGAGDDPRDRDEIFQSEKAAVTALAAAMKHPFADLQGSEHPSNDDTTSSSVNHTSPVINNRRAAVRFWGHRVCMAVLNSAAIDVNFPFVATAFGNAHLVPRRRENRSHRHHPVRMPEYVGLMEKDEDEVEAASTNNEWELVSNVEQHDDDDEDEDENELERAIDEESQSDEDDSDSSSDDGYAGGKKSKFSAAKNVPCSSHLKSYQGHCNVETTKDVNFYGLQEEYVVSGSDCGNFFIWEKKSGRLVNILEGDREVVNVIQREY